MAAYILPIVSSYSYLGVDFSRNGACDVHMGGLLDNGEKGVDQLHGVIGGGSIDLGARRHLLLSVIIPSIEYGSGVWSVGG